jgi:hypothetical protein
MLKLSAQFHVIIVVVHVGAEEKVKMGQNRMNLSLAQKVVHF